MNGVKDHRYDDIIAPMVFDELMDVESLARSIYDIHADAVKGAGLNLSDLILADNMMKKLGEIESTIQPVFSTIFGSSPLDRYDDVFDQISDFAEHLACRHVFADGNKRTTFLVSLGLLEMRGIHLSVEDNADPRNHLLYRWIQDVVTHSRNRAELADFLRSNSIVDS